MKTPIILFTILIAGCANLSEMTDEERSTYLDRQEDRLYDRQEALVEAKMDYYERPQPAGILGDLWLSGNGVRR